MDIFQKNGKSISYQITTKKIKNTYFRLKDGYLQVTTGPATKKKLILTYIDLKFEMLHQKLELAKSVESTDEIMLWGKKYEFIISHGKFRYQITDDRVIVHSTWTDEKKIKKRIYASEIQKHLEEIKAEIDQTISKKGLSPIPFKLKYLKSKFGSYHRKNKEITLNTFLARLDVIYLRYVIYHEYAHAIVFNHSKDYYKLLSEFMPNHRVYQKDLKKIAII